jgi:hypothetical protein
MMLRVQELAATDTMAGSTSTSTTADTGTSDDMNSRCNISLAPYSKRRSYATAVPLAVVIVAAAAATAAA